MRYDLTVSNCTDYLESMFFENIRFNREEDDILYFTAIDEDDQEKDVMFETMENENVCVSVKEDGNWFILEILAD